MAVTPSKEGNHMGHMLLLVDDDPNTLAGLRRALHGEPYHVMATTSPYEALEILRFKPVDVVLADEGMPNMSGTQFLVKVRERNPDTVRMMLTGKATLDIAIQAINEAGITHFFTKPCNTMELGFAIRHAMRQKDLMVAARRLLHEVRRQSAAIERMRFDHPELSRVELDQDGALVLEDAPGGYEELMKAIETQLGADPKP